METFREPHTLFRSKVSGPEFMLKISAREFMPTPDCVAVTNMRYVPRQGQRETKRGGKAMGTIYGLMRYFDSKRFWAPLGATAILATATVALAVPPPSVVELDDDPPAAA